MISVSECRNEALQAAAAAADLEAGPKAGPAWAVAQGVLRTVFPVCLALAAVVLCNVAFCTVGLTGSLTGGRKSSLAPLMVGTHVCIDGLVTQLEYNGRVGCVRLLLDDRYSIKLADGTKIALKRENLRPMGAAQAHAHVLGLEAPPRFSISQLKRRTVRLR